MCQIFFKIKRPAAPFKEQAGQTVASDGLPTRKPACANADGDCEGTDAEKLTKRRWGNGRTACRYPTLMHRMEKR